VSRPDLLTILEGAGLAIVALTVLVFARALILRFRRKRQTAQAWRGPPAKSERPEAMSGTKDDLVRIGRWDREARRKQDDLFSASPKGEDR